MTQTADSVRRRPASWPPELAFVRTDRTGLVTEASESLTTLLKTPHSSLIGHSFADWSVTTWPAAIDTQVFQAVRDGESYAGYLPLRRPDGADVWTFAIVTPVANGLLFVHTPPADPAALDEVRALFDHLAKAEERARNAGDQSAEAKEQGAKAAQEFWATSIWSTYPEFMAPAMVAQARAVKPAPPVQGGAAPGEDPVIGLATAIGALDAQVRPRLERADTLNRLAETLRETSWGGAEVMGTLGRIAAAAMVGSAEVGDAAPALVSTAKAAATLGAGTLTRVQALLADVTEARGAVGRLEARLATVAVHGALVRAAADAAWPPADPGPGTVPAACAVELARVLVSGIDELISNLASTRDILARVREGADAAAEDVARFHGFINSWRLQVPRWHITERIEAHLGVMDGRQRLAAEHVAQLRELAGTCQEGIEYCAAAGLFGPMNAIGHLATATRGPKGRHAVATPPDLGALA
ncbi:MAG: PAS domain-containing protein [Bifidobacteriaceae bacterium]|jgi:hypothetical protein|nr:PAS domain-containing protein [Bifidobacteriaceae bacterium]